MDNDCSPPPLYSEREFDQKISDALQASLNIASPGTQRPQAQTNVRDDGQWEVWDEALFETNAAVASGLTQKQPVPVSSSHSSETARLSSGRDLPSLPGELVPGVPRIFDPQAGSSSEKGRFISREPTPTPESPAHAAPAPSRSSETSHLELSEAPTSAASEPNRATPPDHPELSDNAYDGHRSETPPPEFTPIGPSLDGPPFEEVDSQDSGPRNPPPPAEFVDQHAPEDSVTLSYIPSLPSDQVSLYSMDEEAVYEDGMPAMSFIPAESILSLPRTPPPQPMQHNIHRQSMPVGQTRTVSRPPRPSSYAPPSSFARPSPASPPRRGLPDLPESGVSTPVPDALSLYNAAVVPHLKGRKPVLPPKPPRASFSSSSSASSVYDPRQSMVSLNSEPPHHQQQYPYMFGGAAESSLSVASYGPSISSMESNMSHSQYYVPPLPPPPPPGGVPGQWGPSHPRYR